MHALNPATNKSNSQCATQFSPRRWQSRRKRKDRYCFLLRLPADGFHTGITKVITYLLRNSVRGGGSRVKRERIDIVFCYACRLTDSTWLQTRIIPISFVYTVGKFNKDEENKHRFYHFIETFRSTLATSSVEDIHKRNQTNNSTANIKENFLLCSFIFLATELLFDERRQYCRYKSRKWKNIYNRQYCRKAGRKTQKETHDICLSSRR